MNADQTVENLLKYERLNSLQTLAAILLSISLVLSLTTNFLLPNGVIATVAFSVMILLTIAANIRNSTIRTLLLLTPETISSSIVTIILLSIFKINSATIIISTIASFVFSTIALAIMICSVCHPLRANHEIS